MATRVLFKRNNNSGRVPLPTQMVQGELALNTADGKIFIKKEDDTVLDVTKTIFDGNTSVTADQNNGSARITAKVNNDTKYEVDAAGTNFLKPVIIKNQSPLIFTDSVNNNSVSIKGPDNVDFSYEVKLPRSQPIDRSVLGLDGNGNLEWTTPDSFGGNRVYVSETRGNDDNDGVNAPVRNLKRAAQIAASLGLRPLDLPGGTEETALEFFNAKRLLEENRTFIQEQVIKYIEANFVNFTFDVAEFTNDFNLVIDAVAFDIALGSNYKSVTAGLAYTRANREFLRDNQILQTVSAIREAQRLGVDLMTDPTASTRYVAAYDEIIDILENGAASADTLVYPPPAGVDQSAVNTRDLLIDNRAFLQAEVIAWINANFSDFVYDVEEFRRSTSEFIDAAYYDSALNTNYNQVTAGTAYTLEYSDDLENQMMQITTAVEFARDQAIISVSADVTAVARVTAAFNEILDILKNGTVAADTIIYNTNATTTLEQIDARDQLQLNKNFLQDNLLAYTNKNFVGYVYNGKVQQGFESDLGLIIDAAGFDTVLGTNYNQVTAGLANIRATSNYSLSNQKLQTVAGIRFAQTRSELSTSSNAIAQGRVTVAFEEIVDIILNGAAAANIIQFPNSPNATINQVNSKTQLQQNRAFLQAEVVAFINENQPPAGYDQVKISNDVGFVLDAITYDILYGGNTAILRIAEDYFVGSQGLLGQGQETKTVEAYQHLQTVVASVVQGIGITNTTGNTLTQITSGGNATTVQAGQLTDSIQNIIDVVQAGNTSVLPSAILPNLTGLPVSIIAARNQLITDKSTIITQTSSFLADTFNNFDYNEDNFSRDTGYIIDAVTYDTLYGGNSASVAAARFGATIQIASQQFQTAAAFEFFTTIIDDVVRGTVVTPSQDRSTFISGLSNEFTVTSWTANSLILDNVSSTLAAKLNVAQPYTIYVNGTELVVNTVSVAGNEITLTVDKTLIEAFGTGQTISDIQNISFVEAYAGASQDTVTAGDAGEELAAKAVELVDIVVNVVKSGVNTLPEEVYPDLGFADVDMLAALNELDADRQSIIDGTINFIKTTYQDFVYDPVRCSRDVGFIVDGLVYDILYNGNSATIQTASSYWFGTQTQVPGQQNVTALAFERLKELTAKVILSQEITDTFQELILQVLDLANPGTTLESNKSGVLIDIIINVVVGGIEELPLEVEPDLTGVAGGIGSNVQNLRTAKSSIIDDSLAFITATFTGFEYNESTCFRDTGLIIDAVIYDIILGGNSRSVEAGLSYYNQGIPASRELVISDQLFETVEAIKHARKISIQIIQNQDVRPLFTPLGGDKVQKKYLSISGAAAVTAVFDSYTIIITTLDGGPDAAPEIIDARFKRIPVTISVSAGDFLVDNPIIIPDLVSVVGDSLRSVTIRPLNAGKDMFRIRNAAYMTGFTFRDGLDADLVPSYTFDFCVTFDDPEDRSVDRTGYFGIDNTKPLITQSPYIQNCSIISFLGGNGIHVDGSKVRSPNIPVNFIEAENPVNITDGIPEQGKSMVANAFTMVSFGGTGWLVSNDGYAQVVSCFQIFCLNGSYCQSGGYLSITNSATNFGLYALRSSGFSPNSFAFDRGFVAATGASGGRTTLTSIGSQRRPTEQYVLRFLNPDTGVDVTSQFKSLEIEKTFDAELDVNPANNQITIVEHGFLTGDGVIYSNEDNPTILGLIHRSIYYVRVVNDNVIQLFNDDGLSFIANIQEVGTGTHKLIKNTEEFFINNVDSFHNVYQELTLPPGTDYLFAVGSSITGTTGAFTSNAIVLSWNPTTRKLIISNELTSVGDDEIRIKFTLTSTIDADQSTPAFTAIPILDAVDRTDLFTAIFKLESTKTASDILNAAGTIGAKVHFHRPSILNSSAHTWEYAGSGTDYNALPQNGGQGDVEFEQYTELPGRVYSSGTDEFGNFKVGDFIKAENNTGKITFRTEVTVGQLNVLRLSLSNIEINSISNDIGLGDNELGGASDTRLSTQRSIRLFINNRLGSVLDKQVSTNAVPGALVQLNAQGQINADLIPPLRGVTTYTTTQYDGRLLLSDEIPPVDVFSGDNASETYNQQILTLDGNVTVVEGDVITQTGTTGRGLVKFDVTGSNVLTLTDVTGAFTSGNAAQTIRVNGVLVTPEVFPQTASDVEEIVDNYFLINDTISQFLLLNGIGFSFTVDDQVQGALTLADGKVTEYREGVLMGISIAGLSGGSNFTPLSGNATYVNVPLTNQTGVGINARANITVTNGSVTDVDLVAGGTGYKVGDILTVSSANVGGTGSGFTVPVSRADTRLYVDLVGSGAKFNATGASNDFIADNNAAVKTIANLNAVSNSAFDARDISAGGDVNTALSRITLTGHDLVNGDAVIYTNGLNPLLANFTNNRGYFVKVINADTIELYNNYNLAPAQQLIFSSSSTGTHNLAKNTVTIGVTNLCFLFVENHEFQTGDPVRLLGDTLPAGLVTGSYFFIGSVSANTFTLHNTRAEALASVNGTTTNRIVFSSTGSGSAEFTLQNVTVIGTINTSSRNSNAWGTVSVSSIDASNVVSGVFATSRLADVGSANDKTFLRGDSRWEFVVQGIRKTADSAISLTGDSYLEGGATIFYNVPVLDVAKVDGDDGDPNFTNFGVARFNKIQFEIGRVLNEIPDAGNVSIKSGVIDAGFLNGQPGTFYTNPDNLGKPVSIDKGGTGLSSYLRGDLIVAGSNDSLTQLNIGGNNTVLSSNGISPIWSASLNLGGTVTAGAALFNNDVNSTDVNSGALRVVGGVGVTRNLFIGGNLNVAGGITFNSSLSITGENANIVLSPSGSGTVSIQPNGNLTLGALSRNIIVVGNVSATSNQQTINLSPSGSNSAITINPAGALTLGTAASGGIIVNSDITSAGDIAVNGGDITTTATTFNLVNANATTVNIAGSGSTVTIGANNIGNTTVRNNLTVQGNLIVQGTTSTINSTIVTVADRAIELASTLNPSNATADQGGIIVKGTTDKTILWNNSTTGFHISEHINIPSGKIYKINNVNILTATALGSSVVSSSLTSVGTLTSGAWNASIISPAFGGTGINNGNRTITIGGNLATVGAFATTLTVSNITNVTLPTSGTLIGTNDVGTVSTAMLAGSIPNSKLANSSIVLNGSVINLGDTATITAQVSGALNIGAGLQLDSGTQYNGSVARTISVNNSVATVAGTQTLSNKSLVDANTLFVDDVTPSKRMQFQLSSIAASTTRTLTVPNVNGTIITTGDTSTVSNTMLAGSIANNKLANSTISGIGLGSNLNTLTAGAFLTFSAGTNYNGSAASTMAVNATAANTANTVVARNASGNFTAGTITAALSGTATRANNLVVGGVARAGATTATANTIAMRDGAADLFANLFRGTATAARYADLAENYLADADIAAGTVVMFGGSAEITLASEGTRRVAGIVSTNPAHLMNSELTGNHVVAVALTGRVPCQVTGKICKGDMLVAAGNGHARAEEDPRLGQVIGKALEDFDGTSGVIEVVVGRM